MNAGEERFDRNIRLFGPEGQARLRNTHAVIVGTGGLGSPSVQHLALLGVGAITAIDDEDLEESNRNRFVGARASDPVPGSAKVDLACRLANEIDPSIRATPIKAGLVSSAAFQAIQAGDFIFGCFDHDGPRALLNELCQAYAKPYIDLASDVPEPGAYGGRVFVSTGGGGCLSCFGVLDQQQVQAYFAGEEEAQRRDDAYGIDKTLLDAKGPSVSPVNGVVASLGAVEFMAAVTGLRTPKRHLTYRADQGRVGNVNDRPKANCYYCRVQYGRREAADVERYLRGKHLR
ncbi:ThiF family adenylyltransferase [Sphingomonas parva]|uniref:ThiF family adenylyltransferase n=1 Tax=Sphingomonas parva TaxID=2555898 RepID=A0A4Y8ZUP5_9SPHN|nr:ThiF family adenylyltransferase [Sphingomonas parva]TFI58865.1 ThiF family adenylyltransferase [Sphingomonas parva]